MRPRPASARPGPYAAAARLRHGGAGDGRHHEHHRPSRRPADARRRLDRRHHGRAVHRDRHRRRAASPRADRQGHEDRRRHARLPGRDPRERARPLLRHRRVAGAARRAPSVDRALRTPTRPPTATSSSPAATTPSIASSAPRIERPALVDDARFVTNDKRSRQRRCADRQISSAPSPVTATPIGWLCWTTLGMPCGPINDDRRQSPTIPRSPPAT